MRIYTKSGDKGTTSLVYGERIAKSDIRVDAYGTCDEANSMIGLAISYLKDTVFENDQAFNDIFQRVQTALFHVGAELSTPAGKEVKWKITQEDISALEKNIDGWDAELEPLKNFILPGGHQAGAGLHFARTIVRRAERCAVGLEEVNPLAIAYLNRLSDFLFVAARLVNARLGMKENNLHRD
jgi:cob(I)alamin adenosyltransferase